MVDIACIGLQWMEWLKCIEIEKVTQYQKLA